jgi:hypothetical protein
VKDPGATEEVTAEGISVIRGKATPEELAAVVAVLMVRLSAEQPVPKRPASASWRRFERIPAYRNLCAWAHRGMTGR